jgi:hypothetical protein
MDFDTTATDLHAAIAAVCPIDGVSIGRKNDKSTWRIDFAPEATDAEKAAADAVKAAFDLAVMAERARVKREREAEVQNKMRALAEKLVDDPDLLDRLGRVR